MKNYILNINLIGGLTLLFFNTAKIHAQATTDVSKGNSAIRLVDNKGTIKFLQSSNGITQIVNTTNDLTTTTWQLGGTLIENTYIDVAGKVFVFDKLDLVASTDPASTDASDKADHGNGTGWTLLVRDESSGAVKKMMASELMLLSLEAQATATADASTFSIQALGIKGTTKKSQIWVYRNGAKLSSNDFDVADDVITVKEKVTTGLTNDEWTIKADDFFEVQWIK